MRPEQSWTISCDHEGCEAELTIHPEVRGTYNYEEAAARARRVGWFLSKLRGDQSADRCPVHAWEGTL
jgi:hypothetical protein